MGYSDLQSRAFTQIAYMDLEEKFRDYCKANGTDKAPLKELLKDSEYEKLCDLGISEGELNSWSISGVHDTNDRNGFYACIIETAPGEAAVGFRGSEDMEDLGNVKNDWVEADIGLVNSTCTNQHEEVERFLEKYKDILEEYGALAMTGHSLGGNLAEYATIVSYKYGLDDNISQCVSMDGPGFSNEFIAKYRDHIEKMSCVMYHPRWSFVGTMLNDLPGVGYQYVKVANSANKLDEEEYNSLTRHDTKYLIYDENGKLVEGEQDNLSKVTSVVSEGIDRLPPRVGDALITIIGGAWIGFQWAKETFFDEDGNLNLAGIGALVAGVGVIGLIGPMTVLSVLGTVVAAVLATIVVAIVTELVYDLVMKVLDAICEAVAEIYNWAKEVYQEFKESVKALINKAKEWFNSNFNKGYKYASANPQISVDTYKLDAYAERLRDVNRRVSNVDRRIDRLYGKVGLLDLWNLMQADLLTGYSYRLVRCAGYLEDTARDFEKVERELEKSLS